MIDVLLPVLGRPHRVEPLLENLLSSTAVPLNVLFLVSNDDTEEIEAVKKAGAKSLSFDGPPAQGQYAKKINLGYRKTKNPFLFLGADDIRFHPGWAEEALRVAGDHYHVVSTNDRGNAFVRQGLLATHPVIRRSYADDPGCSLDGPGVIYHEGYSHNFVDVEVSVLARQRNVFVYAKNAIAHHLHPFFNRSLPFDETYEFGMRDFRLDRETFFTRCGNTYPRDQLVRRHHQQRS